MTNKIKINAIILIKLSSKTSDNKTEEERK
jgi:hypothetical protein